MSEQHEAVFVHLVKQSWEIHNQFDHAAHVDEMLLGAVIASTVRLGKSLIDLTSDGNNHFLRFEDLQSRERMTFRLRHMTPDLATAKVTGQLANVTIGIGKPVSDVGKLWSTLKQEMKSAFLSEEEPGIVTLDADMTSGYLYAQVPLIWKLSDYFEAEVVPNHELIASHIYCCELALEKYLDGRIKG